MFLRIAITRPDAIPNEALSIVEKLLSGEYDILHLRKPDWSIEQVEKLLRALPTDLHPRIMLHSHFSLVEKYNVRGVHLNSRWPMPPSGYKGKISRSCHTFEEVRNSKLLYDYVFLSPIFDSISKLGYKAAFAVEDLERAGADGLFQPNVVALGGVTEERIPKLQEWNFAGAAMLGVVWESA